MLILLVADVPIIYALVKGAVVKPYTLGFEAVERCRIRAALEAARVLGVVVEGEVSYLYGIAVRPGKAPLEDFRVGSDALQRHVFRARNFAVIPRRIVRAVFVCRLAVKPVQHRILRGVEFVIPARNKLFLRQLGARRGKLFAVFAYNRARGQSFAAVGLRISYVALFPRRRGYSSDNAHDKRVIALRSRAQNCGYARVILSANLRLNGVFRCLGNVDNLRARLRGSVVVVRAVPRRSAEVRVSRTVVCGYVDIVCRIGCVTVDYLYAVCARFEPDCVEPRGRRVLHSYKLAVNLRPASAAQFIIRLDPVDRRSRPLAVKAFVISAVSGYCVGGFQLFVLVAARRANPAFERMRRHTLDDVVSAVRSEPVVNFVERVLRRIGVLVLLCRGLGLVTDSALSAFERVRRDILDNRVPARRSVPVIHPVLSPA